MPWMGVGHLDTFHLPEHPHKPPQNPTMTVLVYNVVVVVVLTLSGTN